MIAIPDATRATALLATQTIPWVVVLTSALTVTVTATLSVVVPVALAATASAALTIALLVAEAAALCGRPGALHRASSVSWPLGVFRSAVAVRVRLTAPCDCAAH